MSLVVEKNSSWFQKYERANLWVTVLNKRNSSREKLWIKPVDRVKKFLQLISVDLVNSKKISVPGFCGFLWESWKESPSSWRCQILLSIRIHPTTSPDNCTKFDLQTDHDNYHEIGDFLALKLNLVQNAVMIFIYPKKLPKNAKGNQNGFQQTMKWREVLHFFFLLV